MKQKPGMMTQQLAPDEVMVVPREGEQAEQILTMNGSGAFVWALLQTEQTFDTLLEAVLQEYDISRPQAQADLSDFLAVIQPYIE